MSTRHDALDAQIEAALRTPEPDLEPPAGLHSRIMRRVAVAALRERERHAFRNRVISGSVATLGTFIAALLVMSHVRLPHWSVWSIPGGLGKLDHLSLSIAGPDLTSALVGSGIGGAALLGLGAFVLLQRAFADRPDSR